MKMNHNRIGARSVSRRGTRSDSEGLFDWNLKSDRIHFSPRWHALIGCDAHDVGSQPDAWFQRVHADDHGELVEAIDRARAGEGAEFSCRYRIRHKDGTYRWMVCRGKVVRDRAGRAIRITGSQSDVTVEVVSDRVTGLPNRMLLIDRVTQSIARARRHKSFHFAVLFVDLGRPANLGRPASTATSDPLLAAVARRLETSLRNPSLMPSISHNDLVARMDGDCFALLLDGLSDTSHAKVAADRILAELLNPIPLDAREVRLSVTIGVAVSATGYGTAEEMLHDAQVAQHRARVLGGSHCEVFDTSILQSEQTELRLESDFEPALQRGEFVLFFQPIVSLISNQIVGFEALVRWQHPVLGTIAPLAFISLAEKTGFIVPLGNWVLHEACRRLRDWHDAIPESREMSIAVNISSVQAEDPTLVDQVAEALRESGLESRRLVLELTEGIAIANPPAIITLLMRLRAIGVRISVDDFGTGYSSLAYLRQFPIDTLKIDRSFVQAMVTDKHADGIVAGLMNLAQQLSLHVVAEGIEDEGQCERLRALKCDAGQGTLFAGPLDVERAAELLKAGLAPRRNAGAQHSRWKKAPVPALLTRAALLTSNWNASLAIGALVSVLSAGFVVAGKAPALPPLPTTDDRPQTATAGLIPTAAVPLVPTTEPAADAKDALPPLAPSSKDARRDPRPVASPSTTQAGASTASALTAPPKVVSPTTTSSGVVVGHPPSVATPVKAQTSLNVVHLHRLGNCRGRLDVTRDGVVFVPAREAENEAFRLKYSEFLDELSDDTLILRSTKRTFRFKAGGSRDEDKTQLREAADAIARARR